MSNFSCIESIKSTKLRIKDPMSQFEEYQKPIIPDVLNYHGVVIVKENKHNTNLL